MAMICLGFVHRGCYKNILLTSLVVLGLIFAGCGRKPENTNGSNKPDPGTQARIYLQQNQPEEAEAAFIKAIQVNPADITNYVALCLLYLPQKNYDAAEREAKAGLKIKPDNSDLKLVLAEVYDQKGNKEGAIQELREVLDKDPKNVRAYYKMADLGPSGPDQAWKKYYLIKLISLAPANIIPRLQLAGILAGEGRADSSLFYLEGVRKIVPDFAATANQPYQKAVSLLRGGRPSDALSYIQQFHNLMKISSAYAYGNEEIELFRTMAGHPEFVTSSQFSHPFSNTGGESLLNYMKFTDASESAGLVTGKAVNAEHSVLAIADYDAKGDLYVYASFLPPGASNSENYLFDSKVGSFRECKAEAGLDHEGQDIDAAFADYDNDGYQDLFIVTTKGLIIFRNQGDGTFSRVKENTGLNNITDSRKMLFADFDQDGDLDLYIAQKGTNKFFRNNGDGTFTEQAAAMGLGGDPKGTVDMDFGDWDADGDLDIAALNGSGGIQLFNNNRHANFTDISNAVGLQHIGDAGTAIAFGDYNNDGMPDIFVAGGPDGKCLLLKNTGYHGFVVDPVSQIFSNALRGVKVYDVSFLDFDNDGHQDLLVAGVNGDSSKRGLRLFHNDTLKGFSDVSYLLPENVKQAHHIGIEDFNLDGDEDIFLSGPTGVKLLRNDGGNMNNYIQVQLVGLTYGNSKNNRLGIGAQIELKTGDLYQLKTVTRPLMQFGVGTRSTKDSLNAIRIIWPNGVPETIADPSRREKLIEEEKLKGSCPFLFTWNGKKYEFIKDMMWRSALGMPLAIHSTDTTYSFADPSKEYLLIPGEKLKPKNGRYSMKITEELWEAVYFDKASLVAVDHPDSVDVFVDERFVLPPFPGRKLYQVSKKHLPVSATDDKGHDLSSRISAYDFKYASNFPLGKYQGLAEDHDLILDLGDKARGDSLYLFLRGWVFPTDASVNTAMMQAGKYKVHPPSLQVINKKGEWETVIKNLGYPMGRDKMVIANLSGKFLTDQDRRVRIRTNMQIYWDHIFFSEGKVKAPVKISDLKMMDASLHYRGYSASYRKGGPYGPEWLDFNQVTKGPHWRDLTGYYTRYGDVLPLLQKGDDKYIIANSGDEISIDFDARHLPELPRGWKRDFVIYSEGWVKDGDLNTACGQTVAPLPFHKMTFYPYSKNFAYPSDADHRAYRQKYNTRKVTGSDFRNALK